MWTRMVSVPAPTSGYKRSGSKQQGAGAGQRGRIGTNGNTTRAENSTTRVDKPESDRNGLSSTIRWASHAESEKVRLDGAEVWAFVVELPGGLRMRLNQSDRERLKHYRGQRVPVRRAGRPDIRLYL